MKSIRVNKNWVKEFENAQTQTEELQVFYDFFKDGDVSENYNPNGSIKNIAGIFNKNKNILGMMPHPERVIDRSLSSEDGTFFFKNLIENLR